MKPKQITTREYIKLYINSFWYKITNAINPDLYNNTWNNIHDKILDYKTGHSADPITFNDFI